MELKDFKKGEYFFTGAGEWLCVDVGSECIIAVKKEPVSANDIEGMDDYSWEEVAADPFIIGNPMVFAEYDFRGCDKENRFQRRESLQEISQDGILHDGEDLFSGYTQEQIDKLNEYSNEDDLSIGDTLRGRRLSSGEVDDCNRRLIKEN